MASKRVLCSALVSIGAGIATILFFRYFVGLMAPDELAATGSAWWSSVQYLGAAIVCVAVGTALTKRWQIPVAEFWVVAGAFCLGVAFRTNGQDAEVHGAFGLAAFAIGYLILKYNADRRRAMSPDPVVREATMRRMMNSQLPPGALALLEAAEAESGEAAETSGSLKSMVRSLGTSVRPVFAKAGRTKKTAEAVLAGGAARRA